MKIPFINSVDSVVSEFTKIVEKLNTLEHRHQKMEQFYSESAAEYVTKANEQQRQAARAAKLAANINNLLV